MKLNDTIIWRNKNTNTIEEGTVHSNVEDTVAIGNFQVSWVKMDDVEVIETLIKGDGDTLKYGKKWLYTNSKDNCIKFYI